MRKRTGSTAVLPLALTVLVAGCGGGGGGSSTIITPPQQRGALARFDVNVQTGKVTITPVADANSPGRAILTGGAVSFDSSDLLTVGGDSGQRLLKIAVTNNAGQPLGASPRLVVANVQNTDTIDYGANTTVSTFAGGTLGGADGYRTAAQFNNPAGVTVGVGPTFGRYFVADEGNHTIRSITNDGLVSTLAGTAGASGFADATGAAARFSSPNSVVVDYRGSIIVGDGGNHRIRDITPGGVVATACGTGGIGQVDSPFYAATFDLPVINGPPGTDTYMVMDRNAHTWRGMTYRPDTGTSSINRAHGVPYEAGPYNATPSLDRLNSPTSGTSTAGGLYIADTNNHIIRRLAFINGVLVHHPIVGNGTPGSEDGVGTAARCNAPSGIAAIFTPDKREIVFFTDTGNHTLRAAVQITPTIPNVKPTFRTVTIAGAAGIPGLADGNGTDARFRSPRGLILDTIAYPGSTGNLIVADGGNHAIRKVAVPSGLTSGGGVTAVTEAVRLLNGDREVPNRTAWFKSLTTSTTGSPEAELQFYVPNGVSTFSFTAYLETDTGYVNLPAAGASALATLAGDGQPGASNGPGKLAQLNAPYGVAAVPPALQQAYGISGGVRAFIVDADNHRVRYLDNAGNLGTFAGTYPGYLDGPGLSARFRRPRGVALGPDGSLFITDTDNRLIRRVSTAGVVSTVAGTGALGSGDGYGNESSFNLPEGIAADGGGTVWIADGPHHNIRRIEYQGGDPATPPSYVVRTVAGLAGAGGTTDGTGAAARFNLPTGIAADTDGRVYVVDAGSGRLRVLTRAGLNTMAVSTLATGLGTATGLAIDSAHNLYVTDFASNRVLRVSPQGAVVTLMGAAGTGFADGANGKLNGARHAAVEAGGSLLLTDYYNHGLRVLHRVISEAHVTP
jgi:sugar lactone lactonase YvrE